MTPQTAMVPSDLPYRMDVLAELTALRWAAARLLDSHDRAAKRLADANPGELLPSACTCAICRDVRPWVGRKEQR